MKQAQTSKEAITIYDSIRERLAELSVKLIKGNYNNATPFAYEIGFVADIDVCLKKLKIKRAIVKQDNVQEIELKDINQLLKGIKTKKRDEQRNRRKQ